MKPVGTPFKRSLAFVLDPFFIGAVFVLFVGNAAFVSHELWREDFWTHVGYVDRVLRSPFSPQHPLPFSVFGEHIPHWLYYAFVAGIAKLTHITPLDALVVMGFINVLLLACAYRIFSQKVVGTSWAWLVLTALTLVCWGRAPWDWSGFLHVYSIFAVSCYPATFAFAVSLICIARYLAMFKPSAQSMLVVSLLAACVLLVHPLAFGFLVIALISIFLSAQRTRTHLFAAIGILSIAIGIGCLWPFFPIGSLWGTNSTYLSGAASAPLYGSPLTRIYPALSALPLFFIDRRRLQEQWIALLAAGCGTLYLLGWMLEIWSLGRFVVFFVFALHVVIARYLWHCRQSEIKSVSRFAKGLCTLLVMFAALAVLNTAYSASNETSLPAVAYREARFAAHHLEPSSLVLTQLANGAIVPALGGSPIVIDRSSAYSDYEKRAKDIKIFFDASSNNSQRQEIIGYYRPAFILFDRQLPGALIEQITSLGRIVEERERFALIKIEPAP